MNLEIPYYRLDEHDKVHYIPLKLALNDELTNEEYKENENLTTNNNTNYENSNNNNMSMTVILLIGLVSVLVLFLLLYVVYYFIILRDREQYLENIDEPSLIY
jgi:predicted PurR-regulated permease PerM